MRLAKETRQAAWNLLKERDTYGTYLLGTLVLSVTSWVALAFIGLTLVLGYFALQGLFDSNAVAALQDLPLANFLKNPDEGAKKIVDTFVQHPQLLWGAMLLAIPPTILLFYVIGFSAWGGTAMGIASVRRGLKVSHAFSGWGNGWKMMRLIFWEQTFIFLWFLLLIVPGIRAGFSYALAPYLQIDHPDWSPFQCLRESKRLMEGHRWRLFVLGISFFGWYLLAFAANQIPLVGGFAQLLLAPYTSTAFALFYEERLDATDQSGTKTNVEGEGDTIDEKEIDDSERYSNND